MPSWTALSFQDSNSPSMEHILFFNDHSMSILILVTILTLYLICTILGNTKTNKHLSEGQEIETIWTILPAILLIFIALPSLKTLYLMEDTKKPNLTLKVSGHQWYWSYEFSSLLAEEKETFLDKSSLLRLLKTSDTTTVPVKSTIRCLVTSADVIHSWAMPTLGVKVDALPGRLNQLFIVPKRIGLFTGQCSEICGANHSFMPILLQVCSSQEFLKKLK